MYRHCDLRRERTVDELTLETVRAPWTCKSGETVWPDSMPPRFVWQSRWLCRQNPQVEHLGPDDCRRCRHWQLDPAV
jgi:hypothetical protein